LRVGMVAEVVPLAALPEARAALAQRCSVSGEGPAR
jgi:hypothetical protein